MKKILPKILVFLFFCGQFYFENVAFSQTTTQSHLETTAQNNPESSSAIFMIGQCHFFNGKFAEATKQFEKAIDLDNESSNYYLFQALSYEAQGKVEQALDNYDKAISEESSAEYLIQRGYLRYKLKKYVGAAQDFREILVTYETMTEVQKLLQECEKNGGTADKETESNSTTIKIVTEQPKIFIERFLKQFERFGDAGQLYRGMLYAFTNDFDKAITAFDYFIKQGQDIKSMYFYGIANELKGDDNEAAISYLNAIKSTEEEIIKSSFEKLAGFSKAAKNIIRLKNDKLNYQFIVNNLATKLGSMPKIAATDHEKIIKGELRGAKNAYTFVLEKQTNNSYQIVVRNKGMEKVMLSELKIEKKGKVVIIKIHWAEQKDGSEISWVIRPQDIFTARYAPSVNANYSQEGQRLQKARNQHLDWKALAAIRPDKIGLHETLSYATKAFIVGYLMR